MSSPAADGGAIQNFIRSLYSGHFYSTAPHLGLKVGIRNLLLLAAILGVVSGVQFASALRREWQLRIEDPTLPLMVLSNGRLSVEGAPQPYVRREGTGAALIIDTTGTYTDVPDSIPEGLFVGADKVIYKNPGLSKTYQMSVVESALGSVVGGNGQAIRLDEAALQRIGKAVMPGVLLAGTPLAFLYYFAVNLFLSVLLAGLALMVMRRVAPAAKFRYAQVLTVMLFVITPVSLLFKFLGLVAPEYSGRLLMFYPALAASLLLAALRASLAPPEPPPPPA